MMRRQSLDNLLRGLSALLLASLVGLFGRETKGADRNPEELGPIIQVGLAAVDVTPAGPIRLMGYGSRQTETEEVAQRLQAKALALGSDAEGPAVLITVDNCAVPASITEEIARRLLEKSGVARERFAICASHTHAGPCLTGAIPNIFGEDISPEQQEHVDSYTRRFTDLLEQVASTALAARRPGRLARTRGTVTFAANRRKMLDGKWVGFGVNPDGPVDHDLPMLRVTDPDGKLRGLLVSYACHATTVKSNRLHGDWAGSAQQMIEANHPGAIAMIAAGCGADANPSPFDEELVDQHGKADAAREAIKYQKGRSFLWVDELSDLLAEYEAQRDDYATLDEFFPRIIAFFDEYADKFTERQEAISAKRPKVVSITPANGATDVDPARKVVKVVFDRPMKNGCWSMVGGGPNFPEISGSPSYDSTLTTWTVPVKLKPQWSYRFMLNSPSFQSFQSGAGVPLAPVDVSFTTGEVNQ